MIRKLKRALGGLACAILLSFGAVTQAQVFDLGTVLNGTPPASNPPWLTATFTTLFPGSVSLTLSAHLTVASEFIGEIGLNLRPDLSPASLFFTQSSGPAFSSVNQPLNQDTLKLVGGGSQGGGFDLMIDWPGGSSQRFNAKDVVTLTITAPNLVAEDFLYYNTVGGKSGTVLIGAHVQGIPAAGGQTTSSAIMQTIPEPTIAALLLAGLALLTLSRSRREAFLNRSKRS